MNRERFELLLRVEIGAEQAPDQALDTAVKKRIAQVRHRHCDWLAVGLTGASFIMILLESLLLCILFGTAAAGISIVIQISILNLVVSCCILRRKIKEGELI